MKPQWLAPDAWRRGLGSELLVLLGALATGLIVVPLLIWAVGNAALGPYGGGNAWSLWGRFFTGLSQASLPIWALALAPYLLLWFVRIWLGLMRR